MGFIPYGRQSIDEEDIQAVVRVLRSDWLTTGPIVQEFENKLATRVGAKYAVVFNSGTSALHAAYFAAGVGPGDEVITSPITFAATANAALYLGARPVFVDVDSNTANIDTSKITDAITKRTKVIAPVDFMGHPCDIDRILEIAYDRGIIVVEDAAHALGAESNGRPVGSISDMTVFSFHPVKHITTGEGGAVATNNKNFYNQLVMFRNHGITREPQNMDELHGPWYYEMKLLGYNYRLTDIQCALGLSQLKKMDFFIKRRRQIAELYNNFFSDSVFIKVPSVNNGANPAWHLYVIRLSNKRLSRQDLCKRLAIQGIGVQVHYIPVYWHPYYRNLGYNKGICPVAEEYYLKALSIPIYPGMSDRDVGKVGSAIKNEISLLLG